MVGFSGDGVYDHCDVTKKLEVKLGRKLLFIWDPMHKAALTDAAMRSGKKKWTKNFKWLVEMTKVIGKAVNFVAWGKSWHEFFIICEELEKEPDSAFKMKRPSKFSETKFADHAHEVYEKFRNDLKAFLIVFEKAKEAKEGGSSDEKKKADLADEVQGKVYNWLFALSLSMVTDVYKVYRGITLVLQKIDILPHDKYDTFRQQISKFATMLANLDPAGCPCQCLLWDLKDKIWREVQEELCPWPRFHEDVNRALDSATYQGVPMGLVRHEEYRTRVGTGVNMLWLEVEVEGVVKTVVERGKKMVEFVKVGLEEKVYTDSDVELVEQCRILHDIRSQALQVEEHGAVRISSLKYKAFRGAALYFEPNLEQRLDPDDLRIQWRTFNDVLEDLIRKQPAASSLDFMKLLLHPSKKLYRGVEGVLSILVRAAVARGGLESVCETMVSVMEAHTPSLRGILDQRRLEDEILVAWNGEDVFHCDQVQ